MQINVYTGVLVSNICIGVKEPSEVCKNLFCIYSCLIRCYGCISPLVIYGMIVLELFISVFQEIVWWPVTLNGICTSRGGISIFSDFVTTLWHTCHSYCQSPQVPWAVRDILTSALPHHTNTRNCSVGEVPWQTVCHTKLCCSICPGLICSCVRSWSGRRLANNDWSKTPGIYFGRQAINKHKLGEAQCRGEQMKHNNRLWWNLSRWDDLMVSFDLKLYKAMKYLSTVPCWEKCLPFAFHLMQWKQEKHTCSMVEQIFLE